MCLPDNKILICIPFKSGGIEQWRSSHVRSVAQGTSSQKQHHEEKDYMDGFLVPSMQTVMDALSGPPVVAGCHGRVCLGKRASLWRGWHRSLIRVVCGVAGEGELVHGAGAALSR